MHEVLTEQSGSPPMPGGVFALGNFDGVHRGHRAVVRAAVEKAKALDVPAYVLTFEPHPRSIFLPNQAPFRLTPAAQKARLLKKLGVADVLVQPFSKEFAQQSARAFVEDLLIGHYKAQHIVAGFDFVFGHNREGNMQKLREFLAPHQIGVTEVTPSKDRHGEILSSSRTRAALETGDTETARHILGRPFAIAGTIDHGDQRGRAIGFPTANIDLKDYLRPQFGVYAIEARPVERRETFAGVANIGRRPTVGGKTENLEFHLFGFEKDIYGEEWEVDLIEFLRPEMNFENLDALKTQIAEDCEASRARLAGTAENPALPVEDGQLS